MAPHSSALAWRIPWTEKPGRLQSMGSQSRTRLKRLSSSSSSSGSSSSGSSSGSSSSSSSLLKAAAPASPAASVASAPELQVQRPSAAWHPRRRPCHSPQVPSGVRKQGRWSLGSGAQMTLRWVPRWHLRISRGKKDLPPRQTALGSNVDFLICGAPLRQTFLGLQFLFYKLRTLQDYCED